MEMWQFSADILAMILELEGHDTLRELVRAAEIISPLPLLCKWRNQTQRDELPFQRPLSKLVAKLGPDFLIILYLLSVMSSMAGHAISNINNLL